MAHISDADYETLNVVCDACHVSLTYNRRDDLGTLEPISGRDIRCTVCGETFWLTGDVVNAAHEMFIFAADAHIASKHYMLAISSLAQAWELFFADFAYSNYVYRPVFAVSRDRTSLDALNRVQGTLSKVIAKYNFTQLRNLVCNTIIKSWHPLDIAEAEDLVHRIHDEGVFADPRSEQIASIQDPILRAAVTRLRSIQIGDLRNRASHKQAYRPTRAEATACRDDEIMFLYELRDLLGVGEFDDHQFGLVTIPPWWRSKLNEGVSED